LIDRGSLSRYTYDAKGERVIKSHGDMQALFFNGVEAGFVNHNNNYTIYVSPYMVARREGFSKHYFIETQRIASRLGEGQFLNNALSPTQGITAGERDYQERVRLISQAAGGFYEQFDGAPGHPVDPDRPNVPLPVIFLPGSSYDNATAAWQSLLPEGPPGPSDPPGHPVWQNSRPPRDSIGAGYGWEDPAIDETDFLYFYHPDHLGSTGYVTDINGRVSQHVVYMPFGETFVEEFNFSSAEAAQPYLFNGKELDRETGLYYYGARYYDPGSSIWLSLDPMMEKYPGWSPYNYTLQNPVKLVDPDGRIVATAIVGAAVTGGIIGGIAGFVGSEGGTKSKLKSAGIGVAAGVVGGVVSATTGGLGAFGSGAVSSIAGGLTEMGLGQVSGGKKGSWKGLAGKAILGGSFGKLAKVLPKVAGSVIADKKIDVGSIYKSAHSTASKLGKSKALANKVARHKVMKNRAINKGLGKRISDRLDRASGVIQGSANAAASSKIDEHLK
jgi:RHS repeat-associated protein